MWVNYILKKTIETLYKIRAVCFCTPREAVNQWVNKVENECIIVLVTS